MRIIRHQGTPEEREQLLTVELKSRHSKRIKVKLEDGRRTETAYVAPLSRRKKPEVESAALGNPDKVFHQLLRPGRSRSDGRADAASAAESARKAGPFCPASSRRARVRADRLPITIACCIRRASNRSFKTRWT